MENKKWTQEELNILKKYYPIYGINYCFSKLNRTKRSIKQKRKNLNIPPNNESVKPHYYKENLDFIVKSSKSYTECLYKISIQNTGSSQSVLKKYINRYDIDITHFISNNNTIKIPLKDILVKKSTYSRKNLKERLYKEGLKERLCEKCGQGEYWNGDKMSLILDHINGVNDDNRIENLRIVCPNCNATLDTHCKGNKRIYEMSKNNKRKQLIKKQTQNEKNKNGGITYKENTKHKNSRKIERPPYEQLMKEIDELGYKGTGRKYNVSDNSIRKWRKYYEKYTFN